MGEDILFFSAFINQIYQIFKIEVFDWGFTFIDMFVTFILISAVVYFVTKMIGIGKQVNPNFNIKSNKNKGE